MRQRPTSPQVREMLSPHIHVVAGDARCYTLVRGERLAPAKFAATAEHIWILEKSRTASKFLVFGNQREDPDQWLERYGGLVPDVDFYLLSDDGELEQLGREVNADGWASRRSTCHPSGGLGRRESQSELP